MVHTGSLLGAAVIPLWLLGLWPVYRALEPAGPSLALAIALLFGFGIAVASGYHGTYVFYAGAYQALEAVGPESRRVLVEMTDHFRAYHDALRLDPTDRRLRDLDRVLPADHSRGLEPRCACLRRRPS